MAFVKGSVTQRPVSPRDIVDIQKEFATKSLHGTETFSCPAKEKHEPHSMKKATWRHGKHRYLKKNRRHYGGWNRGRVHSSPCAVRKRNDTGKVTSLFDIGEFDEENNLDTVDTSSVSTEDSCDEDATPQVAFPVPEYPWVYGAPLPSMSFRIFPVAIPMEAIYQDSNPNMFHVQFGSPNEFVAVYCWDGIPPGAQGFCYALTFASGQRFYIHPCHVTPAQLPL